MDNRRCYGCRIDMQPHAVRPIAPSHDRVIDAGPLHVMIASGPRGAVVDPATPDYTLMLLLQTAPLFRVGFNRQPRYADELMRAVMETLAHRTGTSPRFPARVSRERLPAHSLRRLCEYMLHMRG